MTFHTQMGVWVGVVGVFAYVMMGWNGRVYNFNSSHNIAPNEECTGSHDPQRLH